MQLRRIEGERGVRIGRDFMQVIRYLVIVYYTYLIYLPFCLEWLEGGIGTTR